MRFQSWHDRLQNCSQKCYGKYLINCWNNRCMLWYHSILTKLVVWHLLQCIKLWLELTRMVKYIARLFDAKISWDCSFGMFLQRRRAWLICSWAAFSYISNVSHVEMYKCFNQIILLLILNTTYLSHVVFFSGTSPFALLQFQSHGRFFVWNETVGLQWNVSLDYASLFHPVRVLLHIFKNVFFFLNYQYRSVLKMIVLLLLVCVYNFVCEINA